LSLIEKMLLNDLRVKMSYELQKVLIMKCYRVTDIYKFARLCLHIDQILRDIEIKSSKNSDYRRTAAIASISESTSATFSESIEVIKSTIRQ
jgi:hypothetical protein